jgi:hypothetical protein
MAKVAGISVAIKGVTKVLEVPKVVKVLEVPKVLGVPEVFKNVLDCNPNQ